MDVNVSERVTAVPAVALGVSLQVTLGDPKNGQSAALQTHMPLDATEAQRAATLDILYAAGQRLVQRNRLTDLKDMIRLLRTNQDAEARQFNEDKERFERESELRAKLIARAETEARAAWDRANKRGDFKLPQGIAGHINAVTEKQKAAQASFDEASRSRQATLEGQALRIAGWEDEIRYTEGILHGSDS